MAAITSRDNPKVKQVRSLRQRKQREATGLFLVEGIHHVGEAVQAAASGITGPRIEYIFFAPGLLKSDFAISAGSRPKPARYSLFRGFGRRIQIINRKRKPLLASWRSYAKRMLSLRTLTRPTFPGVWRWSLLKTPAILGLSCVR
jgi:hypothetical protein